MKPYRFRIAVGKMFTDRDVMIGVRDEMVQHVAGAQPSGHIADTETNANQYEN